MEIADCTYTAHVIVCITQIGHDGLERVGDVAYQMAISNVVTLGDVISERVTKHKRDIVPCHICSYFLAKTIGLLRRKSHRFELSM